MRLSHNQIEKSSHSSDQHGFVFIHKGHFFRAIYKEKATYIKSLWNSGLFQELIQSELFPETKISEHTLQDIVLIFEHKRIHPITYPMEWSYAMLRDAANTLLEVNRIARKYGYQTIDAHGFNILFDNGKPKFVDLGSFIPITNPEKKSWRGYGEFMRTMVLPLSLIKKGNPYLARKILQDTKIPVADYYAQRFPKIPFVPRSVIEKIVFGWHSYKSIYEVPDHQIKDYFSNSPQSQWICRLILNLKKKRLLPVTGVNFERLKSKLPAAANLSYPKNSGRSAPTTGSNGGGRGDENALLKLSLDYMDKHQIKSILKIGGSSLQVNNSVSKSLAGKDLTVTHSSDKTIDPIYLYSKLKSQNTTLAIQDFNYFFECWYMKPPWQRLQSDAVLFFSNLPHFILVLHRSLAQLLESLSKYSRKYVFMDFDPLGIGRSAGDGAGDGNYRKPPDWYTIQWFRKEFKKYFDLVQEIETPEGLTLFIGTAKKSKGHYTEWNP